MESVNQNNKLIRILNFILTLLLCWFSIIKYIPTINADVSKGLYFTFFLLISLNLKNIIISFNTYHKILVLLLLLSVYYMMVYILKPDIDIDFIVIYEVSLAMIMLITFNTIAIDIRDKQNLLKIISFSAVACALYIVYIHFQGYTLTINGETAKYFESKNNFSPILTFSLFFLFYKYLYEKANVLYLLLGAVGLYGLHILQSRANIVVAWIVLALMIMQKGPKQHKIVAGLLTGSVLFLIAYLMDYSNNYLLQFFRVDNVAQGGNYFDHLLTGRLTIIDYAYQNFIANPWFGTFFDSQSISNSPLSRSGVHNFWLKGLFYGGIIFFAIIITLANFIYKLIKENYRSNLVVFASIGGLLLSLVEPGAPFGPGTTFLLMWMIIGFNLRKPEGYENSYKQPLINEMRGDTI